MFRDLSGIARSCLYVSAAFLSVAGLFKVVSSFGSAKILFAHDLIFGVTNYHVYLMVGLLELGAAWMLMGPRPIRWKLALTAGLATNFLIYRLGLWWLGAKAPCPCLGNAAAWTHLNPKTVSTITNAILLWLLATSYGLLALTWFQRKPQKVVCSLGADVINASAR